MPDSTAKRLTLTERYKRLNETLDAVQNDRERLEEALSNAVHMLRQEDVGWAAPSEGEHYHGLTLRDLQAWSSQIRASLTGTQTKAPNPHMRNGLMLRHSFIWAGGMHYSGLPDASRGRRNVKKIIDLPSNKRNFFSSSARQRREASLFSDGIYLVVGTDNKDGVNLRPIPLYEITDTHRDEIHQDEIVAYRWTRFEASRSPGTGLLDGSRQHKSYWVYVDWYQGKKASSIIYNSVSEPVLRDSVAFDLHANRPDGSAFGSPDAISALIWARIIRDLIMNGVKMQDALAMFAFKASNKTKTGQVNTALELARPNQSGSTASLAGDNDLVPMSSAGKGYDFGSIGFVVATMAASLHVSGIALSANTALAGSSYGAAKTLDLPGRMAMETRRKEHIEFEERVLTWLGAENSVVYFDNFDDATDEYRSVQAAMLAWTTGTLSPEGFREELEIIYGRKLSGSIPKGVIIPNNQKQADLAAKAASDAAAGSATTSTPAANQGKSDGTGGAGHANDIPVKTK